MGDDWDRAGDTWAGGADDWGRTDDDWWAGAGGGAGPGARRSGGGRGAMVAVALAGLVVIAGLVAVLAVYGPFGGGGDAPASADGVGGRADWTTQANAGSGTSSVAAEQDDVRATGGGSAQLDALVAEGESRVASLEGRWVPQLGAMRIGTGSRAGEKTEAEVLDMVEDYRARYPEATLLWSGDWPVYKESHFYVVIVARPSDDPDTALRWCRDQGLGPDHCLAKSLRRYGTPEGATRVN